MQGLNIGAEQPNPCHIKRPRRLPIVPHFYQELPLSLSQGVANVHCLHLIIHQMEPTGLVAESCDEYMFIGASWMMVPGSLLCRHLPLLPIRIPIHPWPVPTHVHQTQLVHLLFVHPTHSYSYPNFLLLRLLLVFVPFYQPCTPFRNLLHRPVPTPTFSLLVSPIGSAVQTCPSPLATSSVHDAVPTLSFPLSLLFFTRSNVMTLIRHPVAFESCLFLVSRPGRWCCRLPERRTIGSCRLERLEPCSHRPVA